MMESQPTGIDGAVALLVAEAEGEPRVEPADVGVLNWREMPDDARLHRVTLGDVELYLHERRGSWAYTWTMYGGGPDARSIGCVGVIGDALVFADDAPNWVRQMTWGDDPVSLDVGYRDGMCGSPVYLGNGVAKWGSFPYHVPDFCAEMVFEAAAHVSTLFMNAIDAAADGPRQEVIVNRG